MSNIKGVDEIWKNIKGYEGFYQVSNIGNIRRWLKKTSCWSNNRKPQLQKNGYYKITLSKDSKIKSFWIHSLVAINFLNHQNCGMRVVVNHKDGNKLNNEVLNLELISNRDNVIKGFISRGTKSSIIGVTKNKSKTFSSVIRLKDNIIRFKPENCPLISYLQYRIGWDLIDDFDGDVCNFKNKINRLIYE